ncbi:TIGR00730 family Rossman fold protein [Chloroflexota bacterium]
MKSICVYCGSSDDVHSDYLEAAFQMGSTLAKRGIKLIFGGGKTGLMGKVADGVISEGGDAVGVIVTSMHTTNLAHPNLLRLEVTDTLHQRKARMYELSEGYIALPGGFGTMDELFETLTWAQIGEHKKPIGLLNVNNYFNGLFKFLDHALQEKFIFPEHRKNIFCSSDPDQLVESFNHHQYPEDAVNRWMRRD